MKSQRFGILELNSGCQTPIRTWKWSCYMRGCNRFFLKTCTYYSFICYRNCSYCPTKFESSELMNTFWAVTWCVSDHRFACPCFTVPHHTIHSSRLNDKTILLLLTFLFCSWYSCFSCSNSFLLGVYSIPNWQLATLPLEEVSISCKLIYKFWTLYDGFIDHYKISWLHETLCENMTFECEEAFALLCEMTISFFEQWHLYISLM